MSMYERITNLCSMKGMSIAELERKAKVGARSIGRWDSNIPSVDKVSRVAAVLETTVDYLYTGKKTDAPVITESYVTYPVLGEVAAGYEHIAYESWDNGNIDIPESWLRGKEKDDYFVLRVCGNSMYPDYQDGDVVLVLKQDAVDYSGQVAVALYDDECATLKRVEFDSQHTWLRFRPINTNYEPIIRRGEEQEHCRILGIPKKLIRNIEE